MLADYRAAAEDERRRVGEAREEAPVMRRSRCCVAPPDGKRGCGTGDLRDNGRRDDDSPSFSSFSFSSYEDDDADIVRRRGPGGGARCNPDQLIKNTL